MSGYELSRKWYDWSFENPEKISPNHSAIYFFAIEQCNRLEWKSKFGFPSQMAMDAIGIRKYETYIRYFTDLVEWGFIELVEKSKNQCSANIISLISAIPKNDKAAGEALGKAIMLQEGKQFEGAEESISSINKQQTIKLKTIKPKTELLTNLNIPFEEFWNLYDNKTDRRKCEKLWEKLTDEQRIKAIDHIPKYKLSTPEKDWRKNPENYLKYESLENEIINHKETKNGSGSYSGKSISDKNEGLSNVADQFFEGCSKMEQY